jgi:hypothetical protein
MESAVDFAYRRWGSVLVPNEGSNHPDPLLWLKTRGFLCEPTRRLKIGDQSPTMDGMSVYISDSEVRVWRFDYPEINVFQHSSNIPEFINGLMIEPPKEHWLFLSFLKRHMTPADLFLNRPDQATVGAFYPNKLVITRPDLMVQIGDMLESYVRLTRFILDEPTKGKKSKASGAPAAPKESPISDAKRAKAAIQLAQTARDYDPEDGHKSGSLSRKARTDYDRLKAICPAIPSVAELIDTYKISPKYLNLYLERRFPDTGHKEDYFHV